MAALNSRSREGFALPMALLLIGLIAMGLVMAMPSSMQLSRERRQADTSLSLQRAAVTVENRIRFLLLTEPVGVRGLELGGPKLAIDGSLVPGEPEERRESLIFDGRPYLIDLGNGIAAVARVQDEAGLVNLRAASPELVANALTACGVPEFDSRQLALGLSSYRAKMKPSSQAAADSLDPRDIPGWRQVLVGDRGQAILSVISTASTPAGIAQLFSPEPVVWALNSRNSELTRQYLAERENNAYSVKLTTNISHNDYKYSQISNKRVSVRMLVELISPELTADLPLYYYQTAFDMEITNPEDLFKPKGAFFNAGNGAKCRQFTGKNGAPFPLVGRADD